MRRLFILLFAIVLPLQFTWASAAAYCGHEAEAAAAASGGHFGHHAHEHKREGKGDGETKSKAGAKLPDADCAVCHFAGSSGFLPDAAQPSGCDFAMLRYRSPTVDYGSVPAPTPDRPQWPRLA